MSKLILGGGISGLSAAHYLLKKNPTEVITVIEGSDRVGGWIKSTRLTDGTIFEQGPRTIRPRGAPGANTLQLLEELRLSERVRPIPSTHPAATNRMIYANDSLHLLPSNLASMFVKHTPFTKPLVSYFLAENFKPTKRITGDESIYDFVERRLGREVSDYLISPMICGISGGDAKQISVKFLMQSMFEREQKFGSITKGIVYGFFDTNKKTPHIEPSQLHQRSVKEKWNVYSFEGGIEILPKSLHETLQKNHVDFRFNSTCEEIDFGNNVVTTKLQSGETLQTEHLISSIPAYKLSELVKRQHPVLSELLGKIESASIGVVNLKYKGNVLVYEGFGFLVAPIENLPILGVIYDSCCFPNGDGDTVLTVMLGGHWFKQRFGDDPTEEFIYEMAVENVGKILNIKSKPVDFKVNLLRNAIPQYKLGHYENLAKINDYIKSNKLPMALCGSSYYGIGVNDVILSAKKAVNEL